MMRVSVEVPGVFLAFFEARGVRNVEDEFVEEAVRRAVNFARTLTLEALKDHPMVRPFRDFYWRLGIDPTKQRPAHEALLRRVIRGDMPRINPVVDLGNAASVLYMLPVGIYDVDRVRGSSLVLRRARRGEVLRLLGEKVLELDERQVVLATDEGQILHVFPHRDSEETAVTRDSRNLLVVVAGVEGVPRDRAVECARFIAEGLRRLGGEVGEVSLVP